MPAPTARLALAGLAALALVACTSTEPEPSPATTVPTTAPPTTMAPEPSPTPTAEPQYGVAAGDPAAVAAGMRILEEGGNAVDAAVAAAFAVAVVEPYASGIGGGGASIVVPEGDGERAVTYDYREVVADDGVVPASGTGIPGFVAGMGTLHEAHGQAEWAEVLAPAIELAAEGHPASGMLAVRLREDVGPGIVAELPQLRPGGEPLGEGELLVQEELARTMRTLAEDGPQAFYTGALADSLTTVPGIDAGSLAGYEVVSGEPVRGALGEHEVLAALPPLPGAPLVQMLQVAEALDVAATEPGSVPFVEGVSAAWTVADESAGTVLGDPAFVDVPVAELVDPERNARLAARVAPDAASRTSADDAQNTTHISVVDSAGTAVSMTNTLTHWFGSGTYREGFFLNDQLSRFGAIESPANRPEAGRKSVSWSAPLVVLDDDARPVLVIGSPGGRLIPNILTGVYARWAWHGQSLEEAVLAPRFHLEGRTMRLEEGTAQEVVDGLAAQGYAVEMVPPSAYAFGSVNALVVDPETGALTGAADPRREAAVEVAGG
ncbi:gamma-glutamyltransferase 1 Threonine peptidase. MEROPS family T03 [Georgenia satyanarayanai]|uniref:Gamma-glutamyltransferase 1 Threonine peptidase. MEROPS family T03 n=1 Tax=Georgenia satyanarayanai TaxID=860221 RepID=A0A2Y9A3V8_9MICO|nr:gamma-glutamyltransferase [Georgenia satyanarayanai]PYG00855.1 gamma-glutamyltransferase 1 [Georgenia satyanarayanai]SSA39094.1 gamma-glutamyltransferase 1 Threonine peptidase. MEROPS family T03 [Georgenia satyanarayanai]